MSARGFSPRVDVARQRDARAGQLVAHDLGGLHVWPCLRIVQRRRRVRDVEAALGRRQLLVQVVHVRPADIQAQPSFSKIQIRRAVISIWPFMTPWRAQLGSAW